MLKNLYSLLIIVIITLVLAEIALSLFTPGLPVPIKAFFRGDPELGWTGVPDQDREFRRKEFAVRVTTNSEGYRNVPYEGATDIATSDALALLGDSFTWGWGVADEDTFAARLQSALGPRFGVSNYGVSGYGTVQQLIQLRRLLAAGPVDTVIVFFFENDLRDNVEDTDPARPWAGLDDGQLVMHNLPVQQPEPGFEDSVWNKTHTTRNLARLWQYLSYRSQAQPTALELAAAMEETSEQVDARWQVYAALVREMSELCAPEQYDCDLKLVRVTPARDILQENTAESERWLSLCTQLALDCLDTQAQLTSAWLTERDNNFSPMPIYFRADSHLTPRGHQLLADIVYAQWFAPNAKN